MRSVTMVSAYFNNRGMLLKQLAAFRALPPPYALRFEFIVVDDCSDLPDVPVPADLPFTYERYRLTEKVRWNQDACRNLGVSKATHDWLLLTDMDHMPLGDAVKFMFDEMASPKTAYRFSRKTLPDCSDYKPHPNTWFIHKDLYEKVGGYDERLAGLYGTDGDFVKRVQAVAPIRQVGAHVLRVPRESVPDASTPQSYGRKSDADKREMIARVTLRDAEARDGGPVTIRGRFPWERLSSTPSTA